MTIPRPITTIRSELEQARTDLMLTDGLPSPSTLSARVARLTAEAMFDESKKPLLAQALLDLHNAEDQLDRRSVAKASVPRLEAELAEAERVERIARIDEANNRLAEALSAYRHAARTLAEHHRTCLNVAIQNHTIPGASTQLPANFNALNIPHLMPVSWQGTLGEAMRQGPLPWEQPARTMTYEEAA